MSLRHVPIERPEVIAEAMGSSGCSILRSLIGDIDPLPARSLPAIAHPLLLFA